MLNIIEPYDIAVYQRDNQNNARIPVRGIARPNQTVTATFTPIKNGEKTILTLESDSEGVYSGGVNVAGGWYTITVTDGTDLVTQKVGAGEVFMLWGHSFMQWSIGLPSTDERVLTLLDTLTETNNKFEQLIDKLGPFHGGPGAWGSLGDKLVHRLNVPVLFYGCAFGGTNINMNYGVIKGIPFEHGFVRYADRQPYLPVEKVLTDYVPKTGLRAVLFEHGYNDVVFPPEQFVSELRFVIDYTRTHFNHPNLAFVMVQEETSGPQADRLGTAAIGLALQGVINTLPNAWKGPDFNAIYWNTPGFHDSSAHMTAAGVAQFASDWDDSLTASFFADSEPVLSDVVLTNPDSSDSDADIILLQKAPDVKQENVTYLIYALAALCVFGLVSKRYRAKSFMALVVLAVVFIYRENKG